MAAKERREVSAQPFVDFVRVLRERELPVEGLCDGLPITLEELETPSTWMSWETGAELLARVASRVGGENPWGVLAHDMILRPSGWRVLRTTLSPVRLYKILVGFVAARLWTTHSGQIRVVGRGRLHVVLTLPEDRVGSVHFFVSAREVYRVLPRTLGLPMAAVLASVSEHRAEFTIVLPPSMTVWARAARRIKTLFGSDDAAQELLEHQAALAEQARALQVSEQELSARARALREEAAHRKRAEVLVAERDLQLQKAQKLEVVGQLAGGIAHDFNNVLMVVSCCAELLREHVDSGGEGAELLDELAATIAPSQRLIAQLLTFSAGARSEPRRVDVNAVIEGQRKLLQRVTTGHELVVELGAALPSVFIAPSELEQVVLNLVVNARDALQGAGTVTVSTATEGEAVVVRVHDDGIGIPEEQLSAIFEPFFTTKAVAGTGLGLATVQSIVQGVQGTVEVDSAVGEWTCLTVRLPAVEGPPEHVSPAVSSEPVPRARSGEVVMVVEDDAVLRRVLGAAFESAGYEAFLAGSLEEARNLARSVPRLDLLVTDLMLRADRGTRVAEEVAVAHPSVKVVLMSGYVADELAADVARYAFVAKPFAPSTILRLVREVLDTVAA